MALPPMERNYIRYLVPSHTPSSRVDTQEGNGQRVTFDVPLWLSPLGVATAFLEILQPTVDPSSLGDWGPAGARPVGSANFEVRWTRSHPQRFVAVPLPITIFSLKRKSCVKWKICLSESLRT